MSKDLIKLFENNVETFFTDITENMISEIQIISKANKSALTSIWNTLNENNELLKIKLNQPQKKKIIIFDDDD